MIAFIYPMTASVQPFLARKGQDAATVEAMSTAWFKSVTLQLALWTRTYSPDTW